MLKTVLILAAVVSVEAALSAEMAQAADLAPYRRTHRVHHVRYRVPLVADNKVIRCSTTSVLGLFTTSDCGNGFDPLGSATN